MSSPVTTFTSRTRLPYEASLSNSYEVLGLYDPRNKKDIIALKEVYTSTTGIYDIRTNKYDANTGIWSAEAVLIDNAAWLGAKTGFAMNSYGDMAVLYATAPGAMLHLFWRDGLGLDPDVDLLLETFGVGAAGGPYNSMVGIAAIPGTRNFAIAYSIRQAGTLCAMRTRTFLYHKKNVTTAVTTTVLNVSANLNGGVAVVADAAGALHYLLLCDRNAGADRDLLYLPESKLGTVDAVVTVWSTVYTAVGANHIDNYFDVAADPTTPGVLYVVLERHYPHQNDGNIYFCQRYADGTWTTAVPPLELATGVSDPRFGSIWADRGKVYVVWTEFKEPEYYCIYLRTLDTATGAWTARLQVMDAQDHSHYPLPPAALHIYPPSPLYPAIVKPLLNWPLHKLDVLYTDYDTNPTIPNPQKAYATTSNAIRTNLDPDFTIQEGVGGYVFNHDIYVMDANAGNVWNKWRGVAEPSSNIVLNPSVFVTQDATMDQNELIFGSGIGGNVYEMEQGYLDDTQGFASQWTTPWLDMGAPELVKIFREIHIQFESGGEINYVDWNVDFGSSSGTFEIQDIRTKYRWGVGIWGAPPTYTTPGAWGGSGFFPARRITLSLPQQAMGNLIQLVLRSAAGAKEYRVASFSVIYKFKDQRFGTGGL